MMFLAPSIGNHIGTISLVFLSTTPIILLILRTYNQPRQLPAFTSNKKKNLIDT